MFQPAPGRGAGRCSRPCARCWKATPFQPAPGRGAGRCLAGDPVRPHLTKFQPAPGRGAGRCDDARRIRRWRGGFQPAPGRGAGRCALTIFITAAAGLVSTRARPWGRAMLGAAKMLHVELGVSTRARPWGRAMPMSFGSCLSCPRFNPRPAVGPGDAAQERHAQPRAPGFNPRPAVGPGDARQLEHLGFGQEVSTRARPWGRAMPFRISSSPTSNTVSTRARPWGRAVL